MTDNEKEAKAVGQFRLALNEVLQPFRLYGLQWDIPEAQEQIVKLSLQLHERLNGRDIPIQVSKGR